MGRYLERIKHMKRSIFMPFKRDRKKHWNRVYEKNLPGEVGWYQDYPKMSLKIIAITGVGADGSIIDIGGGTSKLSGILLDQGYKRLTVLDISGKSIEKAKIQLAENSSRINWIEADVTKYDFMEKFDVWHDRAVFHFLTKVEDRKGYINSLNQALSLNGHLVIGTFGLDAPPKCSGLPVVRYEPETLHHELGNNFDLAETFFEDHVTPSGVRQKFIFCRFIRRT
jgi:2-polyprenyl-3-methyl-5-hydroxy-6-metoxy-1,4-benzoquinol methylase